MSKRYAKKVDKNHAEVRDGLRLLGYSVIDTSKMGEGFTDVVVGTNFYQIPITFITEIKTECGTITERQWELYEEFTGIVFIVRSVEEFEILKKAYFDELERQRKSY